MDYIHVELKKWKFFAYFFDGTESSAKEFCRKWGCTYVEDFLDDTLISLVYPDGQKCYAGNYVVIDGGNFSTYTPNEFLKTFNILSDSRQRNYSFMTED